MRRLLWRTRRSSFGRSSPAPVRLLVLILLAAAGSTSAQPLRFGSADAFGEWGAGRDGRDRVELTGTAGAAYLPASWRGAVRGEVEARSGRLTIGLAQTLHPAAGGLYGPEADEAYDLVRALRYVRLNPTARSRVYGRLGPTRHLTLGTGALAREYQTTTAWDERALGLEAAADAGAVSLGAFVDDVRLNGVMGGQVELRTGTAVGPLDKVRLGLAGVHDLGLPGLRGDSSLTGLEVWATGDLLGDGTFAVSPFVSVARYLGHGGTLGAGIDADAGNLGNAFRANLRLAAYASGSGFVPGHVGPFYAINNARERIVDTDSFYDDAPGVGLTGTPLDSVRAGVDLVASGRLLAFGRFEAAPYLRRHVGADRLSAFGLRLGVELPRGGEIAFDLERQGFRGLFSLFGDLGDENALSLDVRVPIAAHAVLLVQSRYGYRTIDPIEAGASLPDRRFLIERRFEPMLGLRLRPF